MYEDLKPELILQAEDSVEEYNTVENPEIDILPPLAERLDSWLETIDK